jgi:hypothetical protein
MALGPQDLWAAAAAAWVAQRPDLESRAYSRWLQSGPSSAPVGTPSRWCFAASVVDCIGAWSMEGLAARFFVSAWCG